MTSLAVRLAMSSQPRGWDLLGDVGLAAVAVVGDGRQVGLVDGPRAAARGRARPAGGLRPAAASALAVPGLPPPAVLRPTSTAVASMPTRSVDLTIRRVSPGRFLLVLAALATGPPNPYRPVPRLPAKTNQTSRPSGPLAGIRTPSTPGTVTKPTCLTRDSNSAGGISRPRLAS